MLCVLPNKGNLNRREVLRDSDRLLPHLPQGVALGDLLRPHRKLSEIKALREPVEKPLLAQQKGDMVHCLHVVHADNLLEVDLAARGDLPDGGVVQGSVAAACDLRLLAPVRPLLYADTH